MTDDELRAYYKKFGDRLTRELEDYLQKRTLARNNSPLADRGSLLVAYDLIYTSTKHLWVRKIITEKEFRFLTDALSSS